MNWSSSSRTCTSASWKKTALPTCLRPPRASFAQSNLCETGLFELHIRRPPSCSPTGGILYNDIKSPITVHGGDLQFGLDAGGTPEHPLYLGNLDWHEHAVRIEAVRALEGGSIGEVHSFGAMASHSRQGVLSAGHSHLDAQAEMNGFSNPQWSFRYATPGWVDDLLDIRETLRATHGANGTGRCARRRPVGRRPVQGAGAGSYFTQNIALPVYGLSYNRSYEPRQLPNRRPCPGDPGFFCGGIRRQGNRARDDAIRRAEIQGRTRTCRT